MKSKYFKNLAKGLVVAGAAFALVNCGDAADQVNNAVAEAQQQYQDQQQGGGLATDPATNPSQTVTDPAQQGTVTPVDPADPNAILNDPNQGVTDPTQPADPSQTVQPADTTAQVISPEARQSEVAIMLA